MFAQLFYAQWCLEQQAFAASYTGYALPARQGNNYTGTHIKQGTENYITNKVTDLENTDMATFWAANSGKDQILADYDQKLNNTSKIKFTTAGYNKKNKDIMMGMENTHFYCVESAFVAGKVDFN